ncbi:MAG: DUF2203 domain-containing protein [Armatimonadota bacterium]
MPHFEKHFTVEEANALLPELRTLLQEIKEARDHLVVDSEAAMPVLRMAEMNGGGKEGNAYLSSLQQLNARLQAVAELGVQVKEVDRGLVDFPAWRDGREVFLCWHLGEETVDYWHELEAGYRGRQPIG